MTCSLLRRKGRDSNPGCPQGHNGFRDRPDRPLRHLSSGFVATKLAIFFQLPHLFAHFFIPIQPNRLLFPTITPKISAAISHKNKGRKPAVCAPRLSLGKLICSFFVWRCRQPLPLSPPGCPWRLRSARLSGCRHSPGAQQCGRPCRKPRLSQ